MTKFVFVLTNGTKINSIILFRRQDEKNVGLLILAISFLGLTGCSQRLVDFTIISSKNVDLSQAATFQRGQSKVEGEDVKHIIIFIPKVLPMP